MTKELFIETISALEKQDEYDTKCAERIGKVYSAFKENLLYDNSYLVNIILENLNIEFADNDDWIGYFCYELDYGKKYSDGCVTREDKSIVPLYDAGKLYDFLIEIKYTN